MSAAVASNHVMAVHGARTTVRQGTQRPQCAQLNSQRMLLGMDINLRCFEMSVVGCRRKVAAELAALFVVRLAPR